MTRKDHIVKKSASKNNPFISALRNQFSSSNLLMNILLLLVIAALSVCIAVQADSIKKTEDITEYMMDYVSEYQVEEKVELITTGTISNILYTEFSKTDKWWDAEGGLEPIPEGKVRKHSQKIPVIGGRSYYLGYCFNPEDVPVSGAFFDAKGNWLAPLMTANIERYSYKNADGNGKKTNYADLYTFTAPDGARFFSYNLSTSSMYAYRQFVSSKPILALQNTGNYAFANDYPAYQAHKDKNLCVIGASGVAYNRSFQNFSTVLEEPLEQYLVGFQEYLVPWYKSVDSYGFAGGGWRRNRDAKYTSIYEGIIENNVDLSGYDEFLLFPATNDTQIENFGEIDSTDPDTYMGALNAMIKKIYEESPNAKIYLANAAHKGSYYTNAKSREKINTLNALLEDIADYYSLQLIDLAGGSGVNDFNYEAGKLTFDGTHLNHEGSRLTGLYLRKEMIGF